ncbi:transporter substrate-binding domain-containing protein [Actimicrobium antarcticum]|uniref:Transporter substrate-binding domain-containing protein n=2 Tax=Actimicrobium antarcticum TaxID=1051899 RepID=A0ABP7TPP3_9BURK
MAATPTGSPNQLQRVLAATELRVCIWPDYYGITYRNPRTRQLNGIDIDIANELGKELGVRVRFIDSAFPLLVDNLLGDKCDIAMHAVGVTPARTAVLAFTQPYLRSDIVAITTANNTAITTWADLDKPTRVIAVQAGTVMEPVMQRALKQATLLVVKPPMQRENEVESGRADAFMTDYPYSQRMLDMTTWARVVASPQVFHLTDYAYALAPGDRSLLDRVDRFMATINSDGRLRKFAVKYRLDPILIPAADRRKPAQTGG